ncbi:MAG: methyltransferase domain-containing protein [Rhodospirillaceae bacterium]|jgi:2-polyprenyl-3-methyl-5-hydroxy-6-metoxy-1,4-benzoquinol methylase|nr:methyltransferase domain-containing protein [Rhodospirillaceae bacterium]MBT5564702.1 methyltransferase domain-containing protein [Rhodospirillaceae bacterium]
MDQNKASDQSGQDGYNAMLEANAEARLTSARAILGPLFQTFSPTSVLDIGCGHGAWLQVSRELGADTIQGVDGPWIDTEALAIPASQFMAQALDEPLDLDRRFDLVVSLEVAEHLPERAADTFIDSLVRHGDVILFSAAVPFQGGRGHVNEQWQTYWAVKFADHGYQAFDTIRPTIWGNESIFWWLRQNTILFLNQASLEQYPEMNQERVTDLNALATVHPALYMRWVAQSQR